MKTTLEMAREAGFDEWQSKVLFDHLLEQFAALIRADEREACVDAINSLERQGAWVTREEAIEAIRARGNT
jgi:hypothetical protein